MPADIDRLVHSILNDRNLGPCVTRHAVLEPHPARHAGFPDGVHPDLVEALKARGIRRLYTHQARAAELALDGRPFVAVTPTASGKTLCYNLPVLTALLRDAGARALYLFPTKALAQDQLAELQALASSLGRPLPAFTSDGDTPQDVRARVRDQARIVLTNPDMLHQGILPHHPLWARFFANLRYVVIDEMHVYRGIFGSHVANVLRRLLRVARFHGSEPVFLLCSATIHNPSDLARRLTGCPRVETIAESGAPRGRKHLVFLNPPVVDPALGLRASAVSLARRVALRFLREGVSTIAFVRTRLQVEVLTRYLKDRFGRVPGGERLVRGYRGGYLPDLRREIERGLREGSIRGVVATNALELGVDIGQLEAAVLTGYPGTVASTWQQAGRAGRRAATSAAVLVASSRPLDQYVITHPETLLGSPPEAGLIDPDNLHVLVSHIRCAAFELPFEEGETFGCEPLDEILAFLEEKGVGRRAGRRWHWIEDAYPADGVALRTADPDNFTVIDASGDRPRVIAQVDLDSAPTTIHPGAIHMVEGRAYQVDRLDWDGRKAFVRPVETDYFTQAITHSKVRILDTADTRPMGPATLEWGEVHVLRRVPGYKKLKFYTLENVGYGEVSLPDREMHTTAVWWVFPERLAGRLGLPNHAFLDGIAGIGHAVHQLAALLCLCDPSDLGFTIGDREGRWFRRPGAAESEPAPPGIQPALFVYERYPGGTGLAEGLFQRAAELLRSALELVSSCRCAEGCPSCVGPPGEVGPGAKEAARSILERILDVSFSR